MCKNERHKCAVSHTCGVFGEVWQDKGRGEGIFDPLAPRGYKIIFSRTAENPRVGTEIAI